MEAKTYLLFIPYYPKKVFLKIVLVGCLASIFSASAQTVGQSPRSDQPFLAFSAELDSLRKAKNIPGLAAAVVKDQELIWSEGLGVSHFDTDDGAAFKAVTPDTPFFIASVTKTFVGLLFLQLEAQGKIKLDDPINDMPGWSSFCKGLARSNSIFGRDLDCNAPITLRNVLNHTVNGKPGMKFNYNPLMYSRLSRYLEYVYGNSISAAEVGHNTMAALVEDNILKSAGMDRTMAGQWQREKALVYFDMAQGYSYKNGKYSPAESLERHFSGGAGIVSTVNDLAKYDIALDTRKIASDKIVKKLFNPAVSPEGTTLPYAFGWYVQEYKGERLIWHSGWDEKAGVTALYLKIPERELTLILLANSTGMWWGNPLDKATVERSDFARLFLDRFVFKD